MGADMNLNRYPWDSVENAVSRAINTMRRRRGIELLQDGDETRLLDNLNTQGTITAWWPERDVGNPIPNMGSVHGTNIDLLCPNPEAITSAQCQGSCYYQGYTHAYLYPLNDAFNPGKCFCGRDCLFEEIQQGRRGNTMTVWKWQEGFFFDSNENEVWILASTFTDDLNIFMWVVYTDNCGNQGSGKVEFWIAPSLEAAAAQGRTCDEADRDPGGYILPFAFSSDDQISTTSVFGSSFVHDVEEKTKDLEAVVFEGSLNDIDTLSIGWG